MRFGTFVFSISNDRETDGQVIQETLQEVELAEETGMDAVWLTEHHFDGETAYVDPLVFGAAVAAKTTRIKIGFAVVQMAFHHPVRLAAQTALLDNLSHGRLIVGIGRGTALNHFEYAGFGMTMQDGIDRMDEAEDLLVKAWTERDLRYDGKHWKVSFPLLRPRPYQKPHPPVRIGVTSAESFPTIGRMGHDMLINPSRVFTLAELKPQIEEYHKAWTAAGHEGKGKVGLRVPIYLSDDPQKAHDEPMESTLLSMGRMSDRVASNAKYDGHTGNWLQEAETIAGMSYDDWFRDKVAFGTPEAVTEKLQGLTEELGLDQIMFEVDYGNRIPLENQVNSLRLMMETVAPNLG